MDKENLYYIVKKGTNYRKLTHDSIPQMFESGAADLELVNWPGDWEKISIADFEDKFVDQECG